MNNNMNNVNMKDEMRKRLKEANLYKALIQDQCDHKHGKKDTVELLNKNKNNDMITNQNNGWSHTAVKCTECETIFETKPYSNAESKAGIRMFHSMANQYKLMVDLPEDEEETMTEVLRAVHTLEKFSGAYGKMIKDYTNRDKGNNNNNNNKRRGGGFGFNSNQFRGRNY